MQLLNLSCHNFRSYRTLALNFSSRFVCFYGKNGAGKTNILEALSLFSSDRGLRKATLADFSNAHTVANSWSLELSLQKDEYKTFLSTNVYNGHRVAFVDGSSASSLSIFQDFLWILWVVPSMDSIFIGAKSDRRSFFDHLVSGYNKQYKERLKKVTALQKERLHVIFFRKDETWLKTLEERIAEESLWITKTRFEFLDTLNYTFNTYSSSFLRPIVKISGVVEDIFQCHSEEEAILEIARTLKENRFSDSEKQTTSVSVHKSQWLAYHPKSSFEAENCSTGEQKAFLISLILAVTRIYQKTKRGSPVLLLDDLMVHLDETRRKNLVDELIDINVSTFFTGTEISLFKDISDKAQIYHVENSICTKVK